MESDEIVDTLDGERARETVISRVTVLSVLVDSRVGVDVDDTSVFGGTLGKSSVGTSDIEGRKNDVSKDLSTPSGSGTEECIEGDGMRKLES